MLIHSTAMELRVDIAQYRFYILATASSIDRDKHCTLDRSMLKFAQCVHILPTPNLKH